MLLRLYCCSIWKEKIAYRLIINEFQALGEIRNQRHNFGREFNRINVHVLENNVVIA